MKEALIAMFAIAGLVVEQYFTWIYAIPWLFRHGSSAAFNAGVGLVVVNVFLLLGSVWILIQVVREG